MAWGASACSAHYSGGEVRWGVSGLLTHSWDVFFTEGQEKDRELDWVTAVKGETPRPLICTLHIPFCRHFRRRASFRISVPHFLHMMEKHLIQHILLAYSLLLLQSCKWMKPPDYKWNWWKGNMCAGSRRCFHTFNALCWFVGLVK